MNLRAEKARAASGPVLAIRLKIFFKRRADGAEGSDYGFSSRLGKRDQYVKERKGKLGPQISQMNTDCGGFDARNPRERN